MINQYVPDSIKCQKYTKKFNIKGQKNCFLLWMIKNINSSEWGGGSFEHHKMKIDLVCFINKFINLNKKLKHKKIFNV